LAFEVDSNAFQRRQSGEGQGKVSMYRGDREEVKRDLGGMLGGLGDLIGRDRS